MAGQRAALQVMRRLVSAEVGSTGRAGLYGWLWVETPAADRFGVNGDLRPGRGKAAHFALLTCGCMLSGAFRSGPREPRLLISGDLLQVRLRRSRPRGRS